MNIFKCLHLSFKLNTKTTWVSSYVQYSSLKGRKSRYERYLYKVDSQKDSDDIWDEEIVSEIENSHHLQEALKLEEKKHQTRKFKMIERKYFKHTQELNLLTWDAKEQIRYLHQEYPNEWTVEKLAESFPVSIDGIKRLLRSQYVPKSLKEVITHDKKAKSNWLFLKDGSAKSGPIAIRFEKLFVDGKIKNMEHAAGNKALPHPVKVISGNKNNKVDSGCKTDGLFASIVKQHVEKKTRSNTTQENPKELKIEKEKNMKLLSEISGRSYGKPFGVKVKDGNISSPPNTAKFKFRDLNVKFENNFEIHNPSKAGEHNTQIPSTKMLRNTSMLEESTQDSHKNNQIAANESLHVSIKPKLNRPLAHRRGRWQSNEKTNTDSDVNVDHTKQYISEIHSKEKHELYKNISYDYPSRNGKMYSEKDAFLYDAKRGYQYPFGKVDRSLESIEVPQDTNIESDKNKLYKSGDNYYDEDGEFLFRVP